MAKGGHGTANDLRVPFPAICVSRIAQEYFRAGSEVYLKCLLKTRKSQNQSGADRYSTDVVLRLTYTRIRC